MMISKNQYLHGFGFIVILLALVRCIFPSVAGSLNQQDEITQGHEDSLSTDSVVPPVKLAVTPQQTMEEIASIERPERKDM